MAKVDFKKTLKDLYGPGAKDFVVVDVPEMQFLMVDGIGDPSTSEDYAEAVAWLYAVSYPIKFDSKNRLGRDYTVPPLEGLWWADDLDAFLVGDRDSWRWTMMMMMDIFLCLCSFVFFWLYCLNSQKERLALLYYA